MSTTSRAAINRANAQHSTGPSTPDGKQRSSRNAVKHGLYSEQIVLSSEDRELYLEFRDTLLAEHQPSGATELFLLDELAQNAWKIRRLRRLESAQFNFDGINFPGLAALSRVLSAAERSFHRSLTALRTLQQARGFVPQKTEKHASAEVNQPLTAPEPATAHCVPRSDSSEYRAGSQARAVCHDGSIGDTSHSALIGHERRLENGDNCVPALNTSKQ